MSFKLIIDIRGLCLLVPHTDAVTGVKQMHVLLPETGDHCEMKHVAWFKFTDGRPKEPFNGVRWDLSKFGGKVDLELPDIVANVAKYVRPAGLPKDQLVPGMQVGVSSHLILGAGGWSAHGKVAKWKIGIDRYVSMTNKIRWQIENVPDDQLNWVLEPLVGAGRTPDPLVHQGGIVTLDIMHAPQKEHDDEDAGEIPNEHCTPLNITHFDMYFPLFGAQTGDRPSCEPDAAVGEEGPRVPGIFLPPFLIGPNVFSCMLGQATVDPNS